MSNNADELEQKLIADKPFQHILKFAPASQRGLMAFELSRYFAKQIAKAERERAITELNWAKTASVWNIEVRIKELKGEDDE